LRNEDLYFLFCLIGFIFAGGFASNFGPFVVQHSFFFVDFVDFVDIVDFVVQFSFKLRVLRTSWFKILLFFVSFASFVVQNPFFFLSFVNFVVQALFSSRPSCPSWFKILLFFVSFVSFVVQALFSSRPSCPSWFKLFFLRVLRELRVPGFSAACIVMRHDSGLKQNTPFPNRCHLKYLTPELVYPASTFC